MAYAWRWVRSFLFVVQMYLMMFLLALVYTPWAIFHRQGAYAGVHAYCRWVRFSARWMVGLRSEIRGPVPTDEVLIAAKHQSFFDIIMIVSVVPRPKFIMKSSLKWAPILGWYGKRIGCVAVERGKRAEAMRKMLADVRHGDAPAGQLIIYPQGTRVAPGVDGPYKAGAGALYAATEFACVPAATNVGVFWPRTGIFRKPGLAVVEFLDPIPQGLATDAFMDQLKTVVETRSDQLMTEAGFHAQATDT